MRCGLDLASMVDCFGWHAFRGLHDHEKVRFGILVVSFSFVFFVYRQACGGSETRWRGGGTVEGCSGAFERRACLGGGGWFTCVLGGT